ESVPVDQPQPGAPRRWEAGMGVGIGTSVNLRNGNLLTVIPILSWADRGPALGVGLFHNSAGVGKLLSFEAGFYLRPGWSISYSGYVGESADEATVVDDDSTHTTYRLIEDQYVPPAGVHTRLEKIDGVGWQLTYKDQTRREYDTAGRLVKEVDASGNTLSVHRGVNNRVDEILACPD
ncbi:MAG: hypothetical protein KAV82_15570, partial [Phycisphaerae bacterium]|nr:hypothetical protein [Phycisphaerae bacterium]